MIIFRSMQIDASCASALNGGCVTTTWSKRECLLKTSGRRCLVSSSPSHLPSSPAVSPVGVPSLRLATTSASLSFVISATWSLNPGVHGAFENAEEISLLPAYGSFSLWAELVISIHEHVHLVLVLNITSFHRIIEWFGLEGTLKIT